MNSFLTNKSLQPLYAGLIFLLLICTAPILSGPGGFGLNMYPILKMSGISSLIGLYMWVNLIVSIGFVLLIVPAVNAMVDAKTKGLIRLVGSCVLTFFMVITLFNLRQLAWGWGLWIIALLTVLLFINVILNQKAAQAVAE